MKCCKFCGREFEPKKWFKLYCSVSCKNPKNRKGNIPWNRGLTIEDERVRMYVSKNTTQFKKGNIPWNQGLTKEDDKRISKQGAKGKKNGYYKMSEKWKKEFARKGFESSGKMDYENLSNHQKSIINSPIDMERLNGLFR